MVWGAFGHLEVSEVHIVPQNQSVNAEYYRENMLAKICLPAMQRRCSKGSMSERKIIQDPSNRIFMQDSAPPHAAKLTQEWCEKYFLHFWRKEECPGNSPDLNPIENL
jgi:hypothetical protein